MCLFIDDKLTNQIKKKKSKTIICYKWYRVGFPTKCSLESPFRFTNYETTKIKSSRTSKKLTKVELITKRVNYGIHVFLNKKYADKYGKYHSQIRLGKLVKIKCKLSDFVVGGDKGDLIFKKIEIPKAEWRRLFK